MSDRTARIGLAALTVLAGILLVLDAHGALRTGVLCTFVLACPGTAWSRLLRTGDPVDVLALGLAISIALAAVIGQTMALAGWWSPGTGYMVLAAITAVGLVQDAGRSAQDDLGDPST